MGKNDDLSQRNSSSSLDAGPEINTSPPVDRRENRKGNPFALLHTTKPPSVKRDYQAELLHKVIDMVEDDEIRVNEKFKALNELIKTDIGDVNNETVLVIIAKEIIKLRPNKSLVGHMFNREDPCKKILDKLIDRDINRVLKTIETTLLNLNINMLSDEGIVRYNGVLANFLAKPSEELKILMELAGSSVEDLYSNYRLEPYYETARRMQDIEREVYDYEKGMSEAAGALPIDFRR